MNSNLPAAPQSRPEPRQEMARGAAALGFKAGPGETFAGHSTTRIYPGTVACPASKIFRTVSIVSASAAVLSSR
jgi:glutamine amidotransferase-like uncharacterized protein